MAAIVHGLKTCDTTRTAMKALSGKGAVLRDLREDPVDRATLARWLERLGPGLVNRNSTTWRGLSEAERGAEPLDLLAAHPTLIKRPVIEEGERLTLGWGAPVRATWTG